MWLQSWNKQKQWSKGYMTILCGWNVKYLGLTFGIECDLTHKSLSADIQLGPFFLDLEVGMGKAFWYRGTL